MLGDFDLAIIGGGILGAWTLHLARQRHPRWRIVLIERFRVGDGATAHSAGVLLPVGRSPRERHWAAISAELYREAALSLGLRTTRADVFWVVDELEWEAVSAAAIDFTVETVGREASSLDIRLPTSLRLDANEVLLRGGTAVSHDPSLIARALISASLRSPLVEVMEGVGVTEIQPNPSGTGIRLDDGTTIRASSTVVATGPWLADAPFDRLDFGQALRVKKVVALHVNRSPPPEAVALFMPQRDAYLMPLPARNQWLFSFRTDEWDCLPLKHALEINPHDRELAAAILDRYQPGLQESCRGGRVFCDAYTSTGEPFVSHDPSTRIVVAGAGSGAGFRLAPGMADEALHQITEQNDAGTHQPIVTN